MTQSCDDYRAFLARKSRTAPAVGIERPDSGVISIAGIDIASLVLLLALKSLEVFLVFSLGGYALEPLPVALAAVVDLLRLTINTKYFSMEPLLQLVWEVLNIQH